jgi:hypothetical protein
LPTPRPAGNAGDLVLEVVHRGADQAGISREYGGIQFKDGDFEARQAGEDVGLLVWSKAKTYFNGKAIPKT